MATHALPANADRTLTERIGALGQGGVRRQVGAWLAAARDARGLSPFDLRIRLHNRGYQTSHETIRQLEAGRGPLHLVRLYYLCEELLPAGQNPLAAFQRQARLRMPRKKVPPERVIRQRLGAWFRRERQAQGWSQFQLLMHLWGLSQKPCEEAIRDLERGVSRPDLFRLYFLCEALFPDQNPLAPFFTTALDETTPSARTSRAG